ncbi:MAG: High-affnity carbon uptake protein Hat/HatR [Cyclobacteriaceae bacterium]|nr:High-affnity carbon uptake protein Hat/HatR [Cyclobacteriaceae bacterium]
MLNYSFQAGELNDLSQDVDYPGEQVGVNPFPGLRPFTIEDSHLFFGREGQVDEVLLKLYQHRSVTIMGYSGSGKSSLMYCGLIPVLYGGFMTDSGPNWKVITIRPGNSPIENLSNSAVNFLLEEGRIAAEDKQIHKAIINSVLRSSSQGLVELTKYLQTSARDNVFFLVDQFEELFRYKDTRDEESANESTEYVNLLLEAVAQREVPAFVALSMRSDFIGACASFPGLTQMINESNYLVPQMTRDQKRMAIEGPVAVGGGRISQRLVKRLLSDIGDNQDQLPILQHALMRTWDYWIANREGHEPMDIRHYNAIGRIGQALSLHANEAYDELSIQEKEIAEVLFKVITEKNAEGLEMRRPAKISEVAALAQVPDDQVIGVVEKFRKPGRSFLMPGMNIPLTSSSVVELSHESFMRIWIRLSTWVDEEHESAQMYRRVSDAAAMYQIGKTSLWRPPDLQLALNWQKKQKPTRQWAQRYDIAFERAIVFLDTSRITYEAELKNQEMLQRRMLQRARVTNLILALLLLIATGFFVYGFFQKIEADKQRLEAIAGRESAEKATLEANDQRQRAEKALTEVEQREAQIARQNRLLEDQNVELEKALDDAEVQRNLAINNLREATIQRDSARFERDNANRQFYRAEKALVKSDSLFMLTVAQSLAAKSEGIDDPQLAGLTSMQGYLYHTKYSGRRYDPYIFRGLYYSLAKLNGYNYNAVKMPGGAKNRMYALAVSASSTSFYTTGSDGKIVKGDYLNPEAVSATIFENKGFPNKVLALSKDEKYLVNGSDSSYIEIINLASPSKPKRVEGHTRFVTDIEFMPDNSGFITASADRTLRFTNQESGQSKKILSLPYDLKSVDISPNGKQLVGVSPSGKMILIDLSNNSYKEIWSDESSYTLKDSTKTIKIANRILSVAWSPNSQLIAFGVEVLNEQRQPVRGIVKLYNVQTKSIKELTGHKSGIADLDFSPDGLLLASAGLDSKLQMWVVDHPEDLPIIMDNNNGSVWDVEFTKNSKYLIASCNNGEIRVWPTDPRMLAETVCPKMERNMSKDEWDSYVGRDIDYEATCKSLLINKF